MTCEHCVKSVTNALVGTPGVISAVVDLSKGVADVEHDGSVDVFALIAAVEEDGYQATSLE